MHWNPISDEKAIEGRRMRVQGDSWHQIAYYFSVNPCEMREAVTGLTHWWITDPAPVPDPADKRRKLTDEQEAEIRDVYRMGGITQPELAAMYGVSKHTLFKIVNGARP